MALTEQNDSLRVKTALVTGASKGLGREIALALSERGAAVALVARDRAALAQVQAEIAATGGSSNVFIADVAQEQDVRRLENEVAAQCGPVHILINNAGINIRKSVIEFSLDEWNTVINTNLTSVFLMCRSFVPQMKGLGFGRILNMTSTMSHVSLPGRTAYSSSKAALLGFNRALALELAAESITVNGISPGPFATEMNRPVMDNPEVNAEFLKRIPLGRWGKPQDIGALACFLCSDAAAFITGTDVVIDGGWCAQ